jgi:hypothetical protein
VYSAWQDNVEGPAIRFVGAIAIGVGALLYFEGIKREIITEVRKDIDAQGFVRKDSKVNP